MRPVSETPKCIKVALRHLRTLYGSTPVDEFGPLALVAVRELMVKAERRSALERIGFEARLRPAVSIDACVEQQLNSPL